MIISTIRCSTTLLTICGLNARASDEFLHYLLFLTPIALLWNGPSSRWDQTGVIEKLFHVPLGTSSVMRQPVLSQDVYRDRKINKRTELIESERET